MNVVTIIVGAILIIACLLIILMVMLQEGSQDGMSGAITGGATDSYLGRSGSRTPEAILQKWTKRGIIVFFILTVLVSFLQVILK